MLLTFACHKDFILFQMDVKSALLNGYIMEEVCCANFNVLASARIYCSIDQ